MSVSRTNPNDTPWETVSQVNDTPWETVSQVLSRPIPASPGFCDPIPKALTTELSHHPILFLTDLVTEDDTISTQSLPEETTPRAEPTTPSTTTPFSVFVPVYRPHLTEMESE